MISFLTGTIIHKTKHSLVIQTAGGVGYEVFMTPLQAASHLTDREIALHTYLKVSDSDLQLFGFQTVEEKVFFSLLMTVSGVGPKTALNILSLGSIREIQSAIARGDVKYLTAVSGLGKKTAERLVVELKNKVMSQESGGNGAPSGVLGEVIDALVSMGYSRDEAKAAVTATESEGKNTGQVLREALQRLV